MTCILSFNDLLIIADMINPKKLCFQLRFSSTSELYKCKICNFLNSYSVLIKQIVQKLLLFKRKLSTHVYQEIFLRTHLPYFIKCTNFFSLQLYNFVSCINLIISATILDFISHEPFVVQNQTWISGCGQPLQKCQVQPGYWQRGRHIETSRQKSLEGKQRSKIEWVPKRNTLANAS